ncbi:hypothetical protein HC891_19830 [Candidatus Gracilibacteria bacterium]|nr:hypothetical protein [Candidatus Gracilibacteria bacterium]
MRRIVLFLTGLLLALTIGGSVLLIADLRGLPAEIVPAEAQIISEEAHAMRATATLLLAERRGHHDMAKHLRDRGFRLRQAGRFAEEDELFIRRRLFGQLIEVVLVSYDPHDGRIATISFGRCLRMFGCRGG